jgi:mannose-6-phosphate isomerase
MIQFPLYPLRIEPIFGANIWGGSRLPQLLGVTLPDEGPIGEAWILSDRADHPSRVANGRLKGSTIAQLLVESEGEVLGNQAGEAYFLPAGMVHSLGGDTIVFEIQQNSDITFRLYDWDHVDAKTGLQRPLQVADAMECIDLSMVGVGPVLPQVKGTSPVEREQVFCSEFFNLWRLHGRLAFSVGAAGAVRVLVCIGGSGRIEKDQYSYEVRRGDVFLLPAVVGTCGFRPRGDVTLLEIAIPDAPLTPAPLKASVI